MDRKPEITGPAIAPGGCAQLPDPGLFISKKYEPKRRLAAWGAPRRGPRLRVFTCG